MMRTSARSSTASAYSFLPKPFGLGSSSNGGAQVRRNRGLGGSSSNGSNQVRRNNNNNELGSSSNGSGQVRRNKARRHKSQTNEQQYRPVPVQMKSKTIDCGDCDDEEFLLTQIKQCEEDPRITSMLWKDLLSTPRSFQSQVSSHGLDLKLNIVAGKGLVACDSNLFGKDSSDPYVKASLLRENGEEIPIGKTPRIDKTLDPTWNSTLEISVPEMWSLNYTLKLKIMDHDVVGDDDCMGVVEIPMKVGTVHKKADWYEVPEDSAKKASGSIKVGIDTTSTAHGLLPTLEALIFAKDREWKEIVFQDKVGLDALDTLLEQKSLMVASLEKKIISEDQRIRRANDKKLLNSNLKKHPLEPWCTVPEVVKWKVTITMPAGTEVDEVMDVLITVKNDVHVLDMTLNGGLPSPSSLVKKVDWQVDLEKDGPQQSNPLLKPFAVEMEIGWKNELYMPTPYKKFINVLLCHFKESKRGIRREIEESGRKWSSRRSSLPASFTSMESTKSSNSSTADNTSAGASNKKQKKKKQRSFGDEDPSTMRVKHIKIELDSYGVSHGDALEKEALVQKLIEARKANNSKSKDKKSLTRSSSKDKEGSNDKKKKKSSKRSKSMGGKPNTAAAAVAKTSSSRRASQGSLPDLESIPDTVNVERNSPELSSDDANAGSSSTKVEEAPSSPRSVSARRDSSGGVVAVEDPTTTTTRSSGVAVDDSLHHDGGGGGGGGDPAAEPEEKQKRKSSLSTFKKFVSGGGGGGGGKKKKSTPRRTESAPLERLQQRRGSAEAQHDWKKAVDPASGDVYYYNKKTKATTWDKPPEMED